MSGSLSKPQKKYLVTVLLGLVLCQGSHTLSALLTQVADAPSVSGTSRFLSSAPWSAETLVAQWPQRFQQQLAPGVPFQSKIDLMVELIQSFAPPPETVTHVLLDSWYGCKAMWQAARTRGLAITSALHENRSLRVPDATQPQGWRWQRFTDYTATLTAADFQPVVRPNHDGGREVYVHVVQTRVRNLYRCQLLLVRESLEAPLAQTRYWLRAM